MRRLLAALARWQRNRRIRRATLLLVTAETMRRHIDTQAVDYIRDALRAEADRLEAEARRLWALVADDWRFR